MPAGGNSRFRGYPARMSERQQLALLLQMTSQDMVSGGNKTDGSNTSKSSTPQQHRRQSRWHNKNGDHSPVFRKDEYRVQKMMGNNYEQNIKETNAATGSNSGDTTIGVSDSPRFSTTETGTTAGAPSNDSQRDQAQSQSPQHNNNNSYQGRTGGSVATPTAVEESGAPCEMRRTPPQNKVDRSATGQTGSSPRVTLRLNQVRGTRDDKKTIKAPPQAQMDNNTKSTSSTTSSTSPVTSATTNSSSTVTTTVTSSATDSNDVYEFKSSKEATPVRGSSSSPNPTTDKDNSNKDTINKSSSGGQNSSSNNVPTTSTTSGTTSDTLSTTAASLGVDNQVTGSPSSKRAYEGDNNDEQDEENRRKKRKEGEGIKEGGKGGAAGRQNAGRTAGNVGEKCAKSGKATSGSTANKANQERGSSASTTAQSSSSTATSSTAGTTVSATNTDRKSPTSAASSPKPSTGSVTNSKTSTPAPADSDGEEDRPKSSDSSSAPKVPPLKIVIPQSTTSEQEQGIRNGKNTSTRGHQLPYVVASSNSNDSSDKDQSQGASGTTSPTDAATAPKSEDKKDFTGAIHSEERSTHHQRVLRSSHRSSNGGNGAASSKDTSSSTQSSNPSYPTSSPLPSNPADRSSNSSPQQPPTTSQSQRHHSPPPDTTCTDVSKPTTTTESTLTSAKPTSTTEKLSDKVIEHPTNSKNQKDNSENPENTSTATITSSGVSTTAPTVELHPRKRKMKPNKETVAANESNEATNTGPEVHPHDQPITNCYQLFLNIRKQIERRRKGLFPVQPKPPQGFKDYLMNRCTYVLAGNANKEPNINPPGVLQLPMKDLYIDQEKERYRLRMQHVVEKEKLVLSVEQEILRVHGRAARALANQSLPFSVCTILKDEEVYNVITPEQEEKDRNARSRYNGRLFLSWLQDVDDKWEKIKEAMLLRHHNEAESLHAVQRMDWEWKLKEVGLCEFKATPQAEDIHVPMVHVSDDFDLLPA